MATLGSIGIVFNPEEIFIEQAGQVRHHQRRAVMTKLNPGLSFMDRFIKRIQRGSERLHDGATLLKPCRFSLFTVIAGALALLLVPQGQDLLRGLAERDAGTGHSGSLHLFFILSTLFWAFSAWYWSSVMLRLKIPGVPENDPQYHKARTKIPRYIGFAAIMSLAAAFSRAAFGYVYSGEKPPNLLWGYSLAAFVGAFVFLYLVSNRRDWMEAAYKWLQSKPLLQNRIAAPFVGLLNITPSRNIQYGVSAIRDLPQGMRIVTSTTLIVDFFLFLLFWLSPQQAAPLMGSAAILLFAATGWIAGGSLLDLVGMKLRIPVISGLFILSIIFSAWNDNHAVRTLPITPVKWENRLTVDQALKVWLDHQKQRPSPSGSYPLFLVAAEGGGIRAAYWTASVLGQITFTVPSFPDHLFAISGVSGGSLGAAVFLAQLAGARATADGFYCDGTGQRFLETRDFRKDTRKILGEDFLSPVVGAMLYPDLFQRVCPWPVRSFDRAQAMEVSWERAWNRNMGSDRFSEPFDDLWRDLSKKWLPALFLNSTWVETGKRLIVSNLKLLPEDFNDVEDANRFYTQESLPLSAAVHLSARFTYISPAGTLKKDGKIYGRAVDGGYFENSGETTVLEILQAIGNLADTDKDKTWKKVRPVVIHISNQPVDPRHSSTGLDNNLKDTANRPGLFLNESLSPVMTMLNARNARAVYARETVMGHVTKENFLHFGVCRNAMNPPLGWVLSEAVQDQLNNQLIKKNLAFNNPDTLRRIQEILKNRYGGLSPER